MATGALVLVWAAAVGAAIGDEPGFRRHVLNAESTFCACAAIDVNGDGRLDVVCGSWWYEAPTWSRHKVRDVEFIRGQYDGYSYLPLDVNGDGRLDVVSANYRSASLYWLENPGPSGEWAKRMIDTPGPMETARLVDVDGDGDLDILPNGVRFAAWWEVRPRSGGAGSGGIELVRRNLPTEIAGHGVGLGDLNGDGRADVIGAGGWLEAPPDPRAGRWVFHADFQLHRDASIPILAYDVDGDGDGDVVWGRGHNIGIYWMEQLQDGNQRTWRRHVIDTSTSQLHSPLLADLDGDGRAELIAGKRYMPHEGRDPAEYDPLVVYSYQFQRDTRSWRRATVSADPRVGFGLDPKAVDLDGDGDVDLLCPGRSGLHWLENLRINRDGAAADPTPADPVPYDDRSQLFTLREPSGVLREIKSPHDLALRRQQTLALMQLAMGPLPDPDRRVPLDVAVVSEEMTDRYLRRQITYVSEPGDRVPAYLLIPRDLPAKAPAMLCLHPTAAIGKGVPAGLGGSPTRHYAHELASRGFVCLVPDYPSFGDYAYDFQAKHASAYASGSMKAIWNNHRAVDVLEDMPQVDHDRIGCIGHSLGGHNALFSAAFDQRLRVVVTSCGFTAFHHYFQGNLKGWTSDRYMPRIRDLWGSDPDRVPFDFYEVLAAIAPRGLFINAPLGDNNFDHAGVQKVVAAVSRVYEFLGASEKLLAVSPDSEHDFPDAVRHQAYSWLEQQLR